LALTVNKIVKGTVNYSFNDVKAQSTGKKSFIGFMKSLKAQPLTVNCSINWVSWEEDNIKRNRTLKILNIFLKSCLQF